jgi:hypothetical protein
MPYQKKKVRLGRILLVLLILAGVGLAGYHFLTSSQDSKKPVGRPPSQTGEKNVTGSEVSVTSIDLFIPYNNPDVVAVEVILKPNKSTYPGVAYSVEVFSKLDGKSFGSKLIKWDSLPGYIDPYPKIAVRLGLPLNDEVSLRFKENPSKSVAQRIKGEDVLKVMVTRRVE